MRTGRFAQAVFFFALSSTLAGCGGGGQSAIVPSPLTAQGANGSGSNGATSSGLASGQTHALTFVTLPSSFAFSATDAAPYADWIHSANAQSVAWKNAGMKLVAYHDAERISSCSVDYFHCDQTLPESSYVHCSANDAAHRVVASYNSGGTIQTVGDLASATLTAAINQSFNEEQSNYGTMVDAAWFDDTIAPSDLWNFQNAYFTGAYQSGPNCGSPISGGTTYPYDLSSSGAYNDNAWLGSLNAFFSAIQRPVITEGLGNGSDKALAVNLSNPNVIGTYFEFAFESPNNQRGINGKEIDPFWTQAANDMISMQKAGKYFFVGGYAQSTDLRGYKLASAMLAFDAQHTGYKTWVPGAIPSGFEVQPEYLLVPTQPLQTAQSSISELRDANGLYHREFAQCYIKGVAQGPCATVVNTGIAPKPMPTLSRSYAHALSISGNGVLASYGDNGALSTGNAAPTLLGAQGWAVVFP